MSDLSQLGSFSSLDDLGPTGTTWHPYAFRTQQRPMARTHAQQQAEQSAVEKCECEAA